MCHERKCFQITYRDADGELVTHTGFYEDTPGIMASEWAEDEAYALADKGWFEVKEMK